MDVIDRVPALRVAGAHAKEKLRNMQIECQNYAYEHGVDKPEVDQWTWPSCEPQACLSKGNRERKRTMSVTTNPAFGRIV